MRPHCDIYTPKYCVTVDILSPTNKLPVGGAAFARMPAALVMSINHKTLDQASIYPSPLSVLEITRDLIKRRWITLNAPRQTKPYAFESQIIRGKGFMETKCGGCNQTELV
jgi:hypothetical protein